jgi:membrane protein
VSRRAAALDRWDPTTARRAWERYAGVRGNVLAGGIAFFAFFSLFPALALGFTVFGLVVDGRTDLLEQVAEGINKIFGVTVIGAGPGEGIWTMDQLLQSVQGDVLTVTGAIGVGVLLFTGLGWVGALRDGVSAVFGRAAGPNVVLAKLADLGVLVVFGLSVLASLMGSVAVTTAIGPVLDWLGMSRTRAVGVLVSVPSALVLLAIDTALFLLLFRVLSGVRLWLDDVLTGALAGGVGIGLLKLGGSYLLGLMPTQNRFAAAASIVVGLLIWLNVASRLTLLAAAWAATTTADRGHLVPEPPAGADAEVQPRPAPPAAAATSAGPARPVLVPTCSARAADRTTLAAGAVLGITAAVVARVLADAVRVLTGRPDDPPV